MKNLLFWYRKTIEGHLILKSHFLCIKNGLLINAFRILVNMVLQILAHLADVTIKYLGHL